MPEVIFTGPAGRLEGRYHPAKQKNAPIAMILHPHPQFHGTMNHQIVYQCYYAFAHRGFSVLRFNFRGVGRSQGSFDHGTGELSDAASALDWAQTINPEARACWVAGFSFGAWIGMQLLMRRPEVEGFISIAPPANLYDFSFLAPCPSSGLIVHGEKDAVVPPKDVNTLVEKLKTQKGIVIDQQIIPGANHFFDGKLQPLMETVTGYLDMRLANVRLRRAECDVAGGGLTLSYPPESPPNCRIVARMTQRIRTAPAFNPDCASLHPGYGRSIMPRVSAYARHDGPGTRAAIPDSQSRPRCERSAASPVPPAMPAPSAFAKTERSMNLIEHVEIAEDRREHRVHQAEALRRRRTGLRPALPRPAQISRRPPRACFRIPRDRRWSPAPIDRREWRSRTPSRRDAGRAAADPADAVLRRLASPRCTRR